MWGKSNVFLVITDYIEPVFFCGEYFEENLRIALGKCTSELNWRIRPLKLEADSLND